MAREMMQVGLSLVAAGVFFVSGLLLSHLGKGERDLRPLVSTQWATLASYSPQSRELATFNQRLQTMEASFEITFPGDFSFPTAVEVGAHVDEQEK